MQKTYKSLKEFYPFYLTEHSKTSTRVLHFIGTSGFFILLAAGIIMQKYFLLIFLPIVGYGFAWIGHFFFEKNKPATFQYPFYSLASNFILYFHLLSGKEKF
jgi:hypothetical protein